MLKNKWRLAAVAAASVLIAAGCSAPGDGEGSPEGEPTAATEQADAQADSDQGGAGPNIDDIPDPVAEVNGTEISKDEFVTVFQGQYQQMTMQAQMTGQPVDEDQLKSQTLEGLVGSELLRQEAVERGLEVSDAEIDTALAGFAEANQASEDEFFAAMGEQGLDRDAVMEQIEKQLLVDKLIVDEYGEFSATDQEIEAAYQQLVQQQAMSGGQAGGGLPPLEQVRGEVEQQLVAEQQAQAMQTLSEELREGADVTEHL